MIFFVRSGRLAAGMVLFMLATSVLANVGRVSAYSPSQGDTFSYSESIVVNNGQGSYTGYSDQTLVSGTETMNAVAGNNVSTRYSFSFQFSNNQGNVTTSSKSGGFVWSSSTYQYVQGTDNQAGYTPPIYVWFAINPSTPAGGRVVLLNTVASVASTGASFQIPSTGNWVQAIHVHGTGSYQRDDTYGVFTATYTWDAYFDPTTGFIVGYNYVEQDSGQYQGNPGSFTYTDDLSVTSTSYSLTPGTAPPASYFGLDLGTLVGIIALLAAIVVGASIYAVRRNRGKESIPEHSPTPPSMGSPTRSTIDLGSKPTQQVVIRDVAKVNCKYCGTLIPTTADTCPYCGGPRR